GGPIPPVIVGSQEGGRYRSFEDLPPELTELEVADLGSVEAVERWALETSRALADVGFDVNLFPVADVATLDSPVADRAFSDDATLAAQLTAAAVRGCRAGGIACGALHFPGLGAASNDTARGPATVSLDAAGLSARDLEPFRAAFAERAPAVVLSLAFYAAYDPITPGALTQPIATGLLRDELSFEGLAITDDLGSGAVRSGYSPRDAALAALQAGSDMVQLGSPADQNGVREGLIQALADGELDRERLVQAAARVIELKRTLGLLDM
ncbi:MAG TPA: glycoside hydrolase family 3 N-terminal domain-containing protein, partial [Solirubrobacterales bacterium]|nr:glycoside hydrolase family 3 N-terminal domain-containing protein [Solirubrobacterales bacterium]